MLPKPEFWLWAPVGLRGRLPLVLEFNVLDLLFLHGLHQSVEELLLLLKMFPWQRVLLGYLASYRVCPLHRLLVYQRPYLNSRNDVKCDLRSRKTGHEGRDENRQHGINKVLTCSALYGPHRRKRSSRSPVSWTLNVWTGASILGRFGRAISHIF